MEKSIFGNEADVMEPETATGADTNETDICEELESLFGGALSEDEASEEDSSDDEDDSDADADDDCLED